MKNDIQKKVKTLLLTISVSGVLFVGLAALAAMCYSNYYVLKNSRELESQTETLAQSTIEKIQIDNFTRVSKEKAADIDSSFTHFKSYLDIVTLAASKAHNGYSTPKNTRQKGNLRVFYPKGEEDALAEEIKNLSSMDILTWVLNEEAQILNVYAATETGVTIVAEKSAQDAEDIEARERFWYKEVKKQRKLIYTDAYHDYYTNDEIITIAAPFYDEDKFIGVVGLDILVGEFNTYFTDIEGAYTFIVNSKGHAYTQAPDKLPKDIDLRRLEDDEDFAETVKMMVNRERGVKAITIGDSSVYVIFEPLRTIPWSFASVIPAESVLTPANTIHSAVADYSEKTTLRIYNILAAAIISLIILIVATSVAATARSSKWARSVTAPIKELIAYVREMGKGNFDAAISINSGDEIQELAENFAEMGRRLRDYIKELTLITAEKERIMTELNVAAKIQADMLPKIPPFPWRADVDIFASMSPAKEVGGDFYDFFLIDDDHMCAVVADVSGKGVPAALFAVIAKVLIAESVKLRRSPSHCFEIANNALFENNDSSMFVTAFMCVLETLTGKNSVPEAREALNQFKYEVASEIGVPLKQGYNGDLTSAQNGYVGGHMVKKMIDAQKKQMAGQTSALK